MQSCVLLDMRQLLKSTVAVSTFVRFLASVNANVLNELVIAAETLQTLLTLVGLYLAAHSTPRRWRTVALNVARMLHLHRTFMHENLRRKD